jgi:hypothetical protein
MRHDGKWRNGPIGGAQATKRAALDDDRSTIENTFQEQPPD